MEAGWRLAAAHWNRGYATEGARATLDFAFRWLQADEIVSETVPHNLRSQRVMEKLRIIHYGTDDFDRPLLPASHPLRRHVFYRLRRSEIV